VTVTPKLPLVGCDPACDRPGVGRRDFLFAAGASLVALAIPGVGVAQGKRADYPKKKIAALSKLKAGEPVEFRYPWDHANCGSVLLKLGREAGGGIGPAKDVVAFNGLCPHMGWDIPAKKFFADPGIAGPCPGHWTTFDLTRHGMVVSGHATQGLPQVVLELDGDDILAVGVLGLIFGFHDNKVQP
jgi:arsenite oxidase small subunit